MGAVAAVGTAHMRCASLVTAHSSVQRERGASRASCYDRPGEDQRIGTAVHALRACPAPLLKHSLDA